ncbi:MAG: hypothetical protein [Caudoviricetes sp.]|nr:MAG: hypothetical protein [Caudoviricetes sp.]
MSKLNPKAKVDYKGMEAYIRNDVQEQGGAVFGLDGFITGVSDYNTALALRDLCVELEDGVYSILDFAGVYFNFIDDTSHQTLNKMLKTNIKEVLDNGHISF